MPADRLKYRGSTGITPPVSIPAKLFAESVNCIRVVRAGESIASGRLLADSLWAVTVRAVTRTASALLAKDGISGTELCALVAANPDYACTKHEAIQTKVAKSVSVIEHFVCVVWTIMGFLRIKPE